MRSMTEQRQSDKAAMHLVRLAQRQLGDDLSLSEQAGLGRLERALAAKRAKGRTSWGLGFSVAAAAVAVAALIFVPRYWRGQSLSFEVDRGSVSEGGYVRPAPDGETLLRFSDGSRVGLDTKTRARVTDLRKEGARVLLESGQARLHIVHRNDTKWTVEAGPFTVRVTGTEFDIAWASADEILDVRMHNGSVVLNGPFTPAGVGVVGGQRLIADVKRGSVTLAQDTPDSDTPAAAPAVETTNETSASDAVAESPSSDEAPAEPGGTRAHPRALRAHNASGWAGMVSQGQFGEVLEDAERRGFATVLSRGTLDDLSSLADAARYMRRDDWARRVYSAERGRFPTSRRAHEAAFFLGGLSEGDSELSAALDWYNHYLAEAPDGSYASQALGHKMMLIRKLQGSAAAAQLAHDYLQRFPDGPYASSAKKLMTP
jgi:ferric-dicitrate binding protein FerR (iron transport regulator)